MKIEIRDISSLVPYERNSRIHTYEQISQIASSMEEFGWTIPLLIRPDGTLVAGHGRLEAAQTLSLETAPCIVADGWTEEQCRAYTIADNKLALNSTWNTSLLTEELEGLDMDLAALGFDSTELDRYLGEKEKKKEVDLGSDSVVIVVGSLRINVGFDTLAEWTKEIGDLMEHDDKAVNGEILRRLGL